MAYNKKEAQSKVQKLGELMTTKNMKKHGLPQVV